VKAGRLIARAVIGGLFMGHGTQKLFGWFDGPGPDATAGMMENLGIEPAKPNAQAAALSETIGGALLAAGAATPLAAASLIGTMISAIRLVHGPKGLWNTNGGYEFNLVLIVALMAIVEAGPGDPSVDNALGVTACGPAWALASLAAGFAGSTAVVQAGRANAEHRQEE
jgi:putative oxidoreductase